MFLIFYLLKVFFFCLDTKETKNQVWNITICFLLRRMVFTFFLDEKSNKKLFMVYYCFLVFMNLRFHCLKIKSLKTTLNFRSMPRAVRHADSTRGALPLQFFVVFLCFFFKGGRSGTKGTFTIAGSFLCIKE